MYMEIYSKKEINEKGEVEVYWYVKGIRGIYDTYEEALEAWEKVYRIKNRGFV